MDHQLIRQVILWLVAFFWRRCSDRRSILKGIYEPFGHPSWNSRTEVLLCCPRLHCITAGFMCWKLPTTKPASCFWVVDWICFIAVPFLTICWPRYLVKEYSWWYVMQWHSWNLFPSTIVRNGNYCIIISSYTWLYQTPSIPFSTFFHDLVDFNSFSLGAISFWMFAKDIAEIEKAAPLLLEDIGLMNSTTPTFVKVHISDRHRLSTIVSGVYAQIFTNVFGGPGISVMWKPSKDWLEDSMTVIFFLAGTCRFLQDIPVWSWSYHEQW